MPRIGVSKTRFFAVWRTSPGRLTINITSTADWWLLITMAGGTNVSGVMFWNSSFPNGSPLTTPRAIQLVARRNRSSAVPGEMIFRMGRSA